MSAVASGWLWYPTMVPGLLIRISPSSAIFSSTPGNGLPTVKKRCSASVFEHAPDQPFAKGCEHQAVGELVLPSEARARIGLVGESRSRGDCPVEDHAAYGRRLADPRHDRGVHLLVNARHGVHHGRHDLTQFNG